MQDDATTAVRIRASIAAAEPLTPESLRELARLLAHITDQAGRYLWNDLPGYRGPNAADVRRHGLLALEAMRDAGPHLERAIVELARAADAAEEARS